MSEQGFASGSIRSRKGCAGSHGRALCGRAFAGLALCLCACSGSTDVVGVLPTDVETGVLEGAAAGEGSGIDGSGIDGVSNVAGGEGFAPGEFLIVAGARVEGWNGPVLEWPFSVSLRDFFAEASWSGREGPPPRVERDFFAAMGRSVRPDNVRFVAPKPEVAERLRSVFGLAPADLDGGMVARVMRDRRSDEYRVALGPASCGDAPSHHGGPCAEELADGLEHP
ncbi:MAG: hypothetical protein RL685_6980 [Pseudomonadota bacterium]|jgi:hypothetical protein